jgi:hypothetical protein
VSRVTVRSVIKICDNGDEITVSVSKGGRKKTSFYNEYFFHEELGKQIQNCKRDGEHFTLNTIHMYLPKKILAYTGSRITYFVQNFKFYETQIHIRMKIEKY